MSIDYISEKLSAAVSTMATSAAPIRKRLEYACISAHTIAHLGNWQGYPDDEIRDRWLAWWAAMNAKAAREPGEGTIAATTAQLSEAEAEAAAHELFEIYVAAERIYVLSQ